MADDFWTRYREQQRQACTCGSGACWGDCRTCMPPGGGFLAECPKWGGR